jgi:type VI protein secretion system component Hcp
MTDTERNSPVDTQNAGAIEDAALDQVVGGDTAQGSTTTTTKPTTSDIHITKTVDKSSPNLF